MQIYNIISNKKVILVLLIKSTLTEKLSKMLMYVIGTINCEQDMIFHVKYDHPEFSNNNSNVLLLTT